MSNKPLSFKDFNVVDYTFSHETDPKYDPDGLLSYYAWQRQQSSSGADKLDEKEMNPNAETAEMVMKRFGNPVGYTK